MATPSCIYSYIHCKPNGIPFYVGKGRLRRAKSLIGRNQYHTRTVSKYGKKNILIGMLECSSDEIAYSLEMGLIKCLRRMNVELTNHTDGGEGGANPDEGTRKRLSEAAKKRGVSKAFREAAILAATGRAPSDETKAKLSAAQKGKVFTEEHRKNISISAKKRGMSEACRAANKIALTGRISPHSEETKKRMSEAAKKKLKPVSDACRVAARAAQAARRKTPEEMKEYKRLWAIQDKEKKLKLKESL